eukprot:4241975-Pyramimonas_sp.AAC.1
MMRGEAGSPIHAVYHYRGCVRIEPEQLQSRPLVRLEPATAPRCAAHVPLGRAKAPMLLMRP